MLGYAPDEPEGLLKRAAFKKVGPEALIEAGIMGEAASGRRYDRFGDRLIFPFGIYRGMSSVSGVGY